MKRAFFIVIALSLFTSISALGQQWSANQLEVWEFEQGCWQSIQDRAFEDFKNCFHEDYVGWYSANPVPIGFDDAVNMRFFETTKQIAFDLTPHNILIYGNVAIIHLSGYTVQPGPDGVDKTTWNHWTDISVKENGRWSWIADHGHPGPSL